jgi:Asp-tRNA(Asn)/Glu-tRNA(Gln) amidotransferase A subunit family amidase
MKKMIEAGELIKPEKFKRALIMQESYCEQIDKLFSSYDFIFSLGTSSSAPLRGVEELPDPSLIWTLGHLPVIAAPTFFSPSGMPFGAQFFSRRWNDYALLQGVEELVKCGILPKSSNQVSKK